MGGYRYRVNCPLQPLQLQAASASASTPAGLVPKLFSKLNLNLNLSLVWNWNVERCCNAYPQPVIGIH